MDNFEARYRAIVDKDRKLDHPSICQGVGNAWFMWTDATWEPFSESIARAAVCWWLAGKLPKQYRFVIDPAQSSVEEWHGQPLCEWRIVCLSMDPADAILTAWEIVLGIKDSTGQ